MPLRPFETTRQIQIGEDKQAAIFLVHNSSVLCFHDLLAAFITLRDFPAPDYWRE